MYERGGPVTVIAAGVVRLLGRLMARASWIGAERVPKAGGALVVANHISHLDPLYSALLVRRQGRIPRFLAKHSLWRIPGFVWVLRGTGQIPVYRDSADAQQSLRDGVAALREGKVVVIYPEGTITRDPEGWPMHARTGVARLALAADVPVLPVVHWGTREVLDKYNRSFRPLPRKTVTVRVGAPIDLSEFRGLPIDGPVLRQVTDLVMERVRDLLSEVRAEAAPAEFFRREAS